MFSISNIKLADKGFYINLDTSLDRRKFIEKQIKEIGISNIERRPGHIDAFIQSTATKAQLKVFEESLEKGYEVIFVGEDDFDIRSENIFCPYTKNKIKLGDILTKIKFDLEVVEWDVVLFGCTPKSNGIFVTDNLCRIDKSTGAWAYLIKKRAFKYILENSNYDRDLIAIDDWLPLLNSKGFNTLMTVPLIIHHASNKFVSTLQPRGICNYDQMIDGSYDRYIYSHCDKNTLKLQNKITVVITGHIVDNYLYYLKYLLFSLPKELFNCKFIIHYDVPKDYKFDNDIYSFFRDNPYNMNAELSTSWGGLISSIDHILPKIKTPYFLFLEHDWVFLKKDSIDFYKLCEAFDTHNFINAVWFNKDDNQMRGFEIAQDISNSVTPFERESRVKECDLITTIRWSNNPVLFRLNKMKHWFDNVIKNEYVGTVHQSQNNVEETIINYYRNHISKNLWVDIRDDWGTYLYGVIGDEAFVGHLDGTKRYQGVSKSQPEINGENYIKNNPIE
jgi:hypothetical protein